MKYLKTYNESLRDKMIPKSVEQIDKELFSQKDIYIFTQSLKNNYFKGVKYALESDLPNTIEFRSYLNQIITIMFSNKLDKGISLLLIENDKIREKLGEFKIYIYEKYIIGLHQNEQKDCEKYFKEKLEDLDIFKSKLNDKIIVYKKNNVAIINHDKQYNNYIINDEIFTFLSKKFNLNYSESYILIKFMLEKYLDTKNIFIKKSENLYNN
jgi:hypothetical protein